MIRESVAMAALRPMAMVAGLVLGLSIMPASAQAPTLAMLDNLERGQWQIRFRDGSPSQRICVRTGHELIQIRHVQSSCNRYVVEDGQKEVTVQYTCRDNNFGRTNIRRETGNLVQLEGNGTKNGLPFQFTAEARRIGSCS